MKDRLLEIVREVLEDNDITLETERKECDNWDSAAHLILLSEIEDVFDVSIPFEKVEEISKISDFLNYISHEE